MLKDSVSANSIHPARAVVVVSSSGRSEPVGLPELNWPVRLLVAFSCFRNPISTTIRSVARAATDDGTVEPPRGILILRKDVLNSLDSAAALDAMSVPRLVPSDLRTQMTHCIRSSPVALDSRARICPLIAPE